MKREAGRGTAVDAGHAGEVNRLWQLVGAVVFVAVPVVLFVVGDRELGRLSRGAALLIILLAPLLGGALSGYLIRSWRFLAVATLLLFIGLAYAVITSNLVVLVLLLYLPALPGAAIGTVVGQARPSAGEPRAPTGRR